MKRLAILEATADSLADLLNEGNGFEQGAFCLLREGRGSRDSRYVAHELFPAPSDGWEVQHEATLRPSAPWISAAVSRAITARAGLLFVHTHPDPGYPLGLSHVDLSAFESLAKTISPMLEGPFAAVVVHPLGWAGVVWENGGVVPIDRILSVGRGLRFLSPLPPRKESEIDSRQRDALGVAHERLRALEVAVVGSGGTGSPSAEQLVRMGVAGLEVLDPDRLDTPSNLRRVFGARMEHLKQEVPPFKVDVVCDHLESLKMEVPITRVTDDVRRESVFRTLLDYDVVVCCTDTHGSRAVINSLAATYFLPVIDIGVRVGAKGGNVLCGLLAEVRLLTPTSPCLWCLGTLSADIVRQENLPKAERDRLAAEGYLLGGPPKPAPSVIPLTVLASGLAMCALIRLVSEEGGDGPYSYWVDGLLGDSGITKSKEDCGVCWCKNTFGLADLGTPPLL